MIQDPIRYDHNLLANPNLPRTSQVKYCSLQDCPFKAGKIYRVKMCECLNKAAALGPVTVKKREVKYLGLPLFPLHMLRCLSCVKQAIFLQPCLFDSDDIMLE